MPAFWRASFKFFLIFMPHVLLSFLFPWIILYLQAVPPAPDLVAAQHSLVHAAMLYLSKLWNMKAA